MAGSEDIFRGISSVAPVAGLLWFNKTALSKSSYNWGIIILKVLFVIMIMSFFMISSSLWKFYNGGSTNLPLMINFSYITFLSIFYIVNAKKVIENHQNLLKLQKLFDLNPANEKSMFLKSLSKHAKRLNLLIKFQFWFNFTLSPLNTLVKTLHWNNVIDFHNENDLIYKIYFDVSNSYMFWPTIILQAISLHILVTLQPVNDLYILSVLSLLLVTFQHLRAKLADILSLKNYTQIGGNEEFSTKTFIHFKRFENEEYATENDIFINYKLQLWIQQHTHLLRLSREFLELYAPALIFYFGNVLLGDCFGIFIVTQDQAHFFSLPEKIIIGSYFIQNAISLSIISIVATHLNYESKNVLDDGFHGKWYECNKSVQSNLLVIGARIKSPLKINPMCSQTAELSIDTLIFILRTMFSLYMALTQIKAVSTNHSHKND